MNHPVFLADTQGDIKLIAQPSLKELPNVLFSTMDSTEIDEVDKKSHVIRHDLYMLL